MKTTIYNCVLRTIALAAVVLVWAGAGPSSRAAGDPAARIDSIRVEGTEVLVTATVDAAFQAVILEGRTRLGGGSWVLLDTAYPEANGHATVQVTFRVSILKEAEFLRVRVQESSFAARFQTGATEFLEVTGEHAGGLRTMVDFAAPGAAEEKVAAAPREVTESDIWKIRGDTLYFFNQNRGLQIIDLTEPDQPVITGTYPIPAAGEQMYVPTSDQVVLLARDRCDWSSQAESSIILIKIANGQPEKVAQLSVPGQIVESRMVGTALYVASNRYRPAPQPSLDGSWEWGLQIQSFDLSDFSQASLKSSFWISGWGNAVHATDRFLFVATPYWNGRERADGSSQVHVFHIAEADGTMARASLIPVPGRVNDKFKMNLHGDALAVVTENWQQNNTTRVDTYSLANPEAPLRLGGVKIIERERLFATRFDGDRLYVVTFFVVDPLWIIDLANPAEPRILGELEIPGWSTYIQPLGDRLLAIGIDDTEGTRRTAVQLFDVADPSTPTLLSKVLIGQRYSSSEANYDEKAFGVVLEANLLLVPFSSWDDGYKSGLQLIDLKKDSLEKRGTISQFFPARRATLHRDRVIAVSGQELMTVDATDRDRPQVVAQTPLSWSVDRVLVSGEYLLEVSASWNEPPRLYVTPVNDPGEVLNRLELSKEPLLGVTERDGRLYVLQGRSTEHIYPEVYHPDTWKPVATNHATLVLTVYDLADLPALKETGHVRHTFTSTRYWPGSFAGFWTSEQTLVWGVRNGSHGPIWMGGPMILGIAETDVIGGRRGLIRPGWGGQGNHYLAFDLSDSAHPKLAADLSLQSTESWRSFSDSFLVGSLIYTSHQQSEFIADMLPPVQIYQRWDGKQYITITNQPPPGTWIQKHYVNVIDFADPSEPSVRKPVNIPGALVGVARNGELLYTRAERSGPEIDSWNWRTYLEASAYDGVKAHRIDSLLLPSTWGTLLHSQNEAVFVTRPHGEEKSAAIETWTLGAEGKLERTGERALRSTAGQIASFGNLLAVLGDEIELFDARQTANLLPLGRSESVGCTGAYLNLADGNLMQGLWVPNGVFGVTHVPVVQPNAP